ncbi:hypothetical protein ACIQXQ_20645 [Peribacillus sp. NPDC097198]|uniref:hypothetical protein n=1 Tax=Peribacillus sp. NPDC097198 TaxID=3364397 RepID=UPI003800F63F
MNTNNQPYFKVYKSMFQNGTYVAELTDFQKVLFMLILSEMNRKEAEGTATGKEKIMRFSHYWLSAGLSSHRITISKAFKALDKFPLFDYTSGYNVNGGKSAPSTIRNLATEEFFAVIDRYTFENLLFEKLKNKEIQYRHIVVYALCKYVEQFKEGSVSVNDFGRMLGMTVKTVNYSRIKKHLEDLQAMKLISFEKGHGKLVEIKVHALKLNRLKQNVLREDVRQEAEKLRYEELGISNKEVAVSVEDMPVPKTLDDILNNVRDVYAKRTGTKAILDAEQKKRLQRSQLNVQQMNEYIQQFFLDTNDLQLKQMNNVFSNISTYIQGASLKKYYSQAGQM